MPVLLGVKDVAIPKTVVTSSFINKIGGYPDQFTEPLAIPKCCQCQQLMCQIVQLYCPLMQSSYHRTLHLFSCINTSCWGKSECWKIFREQNSEATTATATNAFNNNSETEKKSKLVDCWGCDDNTWDDDIEIDEWCEQSSNGLAESDISNMMDNKCKLGEQDTETGNTACKEMSKCFPQTTSTSHQNHQLNYKDEPCLKPYYLNVYEESEESSHSEHIQQLLENYKGREGKAYEEMISAAQYELGGKPVTLTKNAPDPGCCSYCGADRQFEFQLMPALVKDLNFLGSNDCAVEFGTIICYSCSLSCWDDQKDKWREEECFVQDEQSM
ncbi:programmed cell death protein 2-like isoform X2 [Octopus bimaculoides]|uniref:Programmed cell death protein 2 C-terminal domain-containing protein n=2 Tax=Octopus bimaculoides TaxID=37653 RepID=A0A0L8I370_OCTBM|nr:programmed cell death protein 2-like isoform X2 [Octopus bimaculoides]|eukprot:XP_014767477.1 PREDICTED: programmed cell death protein 2-like isoform X2 [Octopus bimaculoides]